MNLSDFSDNPERFALALTLALVVSLIAMHAHALTTSGAVASTLVGGVIVAGSGWWVGIVMIAYFLSSTVLSHWRKPIEQSDQQRGSRRDAVQVLANGGVPAVFASMALGSGSSVWTLAAVCAIASATADTWATETGRITHAPPRSISTWKRAEPGTSGAVSLPGTLATAVGSVCIAAFMWFGHSLNWIDTNSAGSIAFGLVSLAGIAGSIFDSVLGATLQARFVCPNCGRITEKVHHCGHHPATHVSGWGWMTNDAVNLIGVAAPALIIVVVWAIVV